jgi:CubicO group peptidase (beta-lactamase class C family)
MDLVLPVPLEWGCGFIRNSLKVIYGPNPEAFGHTGWGGSFGYADPQAGIGVGYAMNRMGESILGDPRGIRLVRALHECL